MKILHLERSYIIWSGFIWCHFVLESVFDMSTVFEYILLGQLWLLFYVVQLHLSMCSNLLALVDAFEQ